jgi:hypothetical protein
MHVNRNLIQQVAQLPEFSVLKIYLAAYGHVFGAPVLDLLGTYTGIHRLKVVIRNVEVTLQSGYLIYNLLKRQVFMYSSDGCISRYFCMNRFLGIHNHQNFTFLSEKTSMPVTLPL